MGPFDPIFPPDPVIQQPAVESVSVRPTTPAALVDPSDVEMESPQSQISVAMESPAEESPIKSPDAHPHATPTTSMLKLSPGPSPRGVSPDELRVLQSCLTRWRTEVEQDVKDLQRQIAQIEERLGAMYSDPELMKCGYRLHAVLVHEGQAASGHYWAYVYSSTLNEWLKFNDVAIDIASWDDIQKDGVGGYHNTSAYCIMYVNNSHPDMLQVASWGDELTSCDVPSRDTDSDYDLLLPDLQKFVEADNAQFDAEITAWDAERQRNSRVSCAGDMAVVPYAGAAAEPRPALPVKCRQSLLQTHIELCLSETKHLAATVAGLCMLHGMDVALAEGYKMVDHKANECAHALENLTLVVNDQRLRDVLVYFVLNSADQVVIDRTFCEKLHRGIDLNTVDPGAKMLLNAVTAELGKYAVQTNVEVLCEQWHETYRHFRETVFAFVYGLRAFHKDSFNEALPWLVEACRLTERLATSGSSQTPYRTLDRRILAYYRRQCLLHVNEVAVEQFKVEDHVDELFSVLHKIFLPSFYSLVCSTVPQDNDIVAAIRQSWCEVLSLELTVSKNEKLMDFLTLVLDATPDSVCSSGALPHQSGAAGDELAQYRETGDQLAIDLDAAIALAISHGYIDAAINDK